MQRLTCSERGVVYLVQRDVLDHSESYPALVQCRAFLREHLAHPGKELNTFRRTISYRCNREVAVRAEQQHVAPIALAQ